MLCLSSYLDFIYIFIHLFKSLIVNNYQVSSIKNHPDFSYNSDQDNKFSTSMYSSIFQPALINAMNTLRRFVVFIGQCLICDSVYHTVVLLSLTLAPCSQLAHRSVVSPWHSASMETFLITESDTKSAHKKRASHCIQHHVSGWTAWDAAVETCQL